MGKYENGAWRLINIKDLPKFKSGTNKGNIDNKKCVGMTLKYEFKANESIYEIKIIDYIKQYKEENGKTISPKFKVKYIYLKGTECEEVIERVILCNNLINKAQIGGIIPSLNQWVKKEDHWIGRDTKGREFCFSANNRETEYKILHTTWYVDSSFGYVLTNNLNNSEQNWKMHKAIYFNCNKEEADKNIHMCIDHINNDRTDNRIENLRLATIVENNKNKKINNKYGLVGLLPNSKGYRSVFGVEGHRICTKTKYDLEEAKIDNLIAQRYLNYKHNEDQFYKLKSLSEERIKEVTDLLDKNMEKNRNKIKKEKEYKYDFTEKDNLIGIRTFKKDGIENPTCWVDKDFGRVEGSKYVIDGRIKNSKGYFQYVINEKEYGIYNYILMGGVFLKNYRNNSFDIDHLNQKINENYRANLEIVTHKSNMMNKESKGYYEYKTKNENRYEVRYANNWKYFNLYIGGLKRLTFNTEEEVILEVKRRREIVNKYRFRIGWQGSVGNNIKALDEIIDLSEEHELDIDSAYIIWKGLDSLENIKNYLNSIDK